MRADGVIGRRGEIWRRSVRPLAIGLGAGTPTAAERPDWNREMRAGDLWAGLSWTGGKRAARRLQTRMQGCAPPRQHAASAYHEAPIIQRASCTATSHCSRCGLRRNARLASTSRPPRKQRTRRSIQSDQAPPPAKRRRASRAPCRSGSRRKNDQARDAALAQNNNLRNGSQDLDPEQHRSRRHGLTRRTTLCCSRASSPPEFIDACAVS